eukprot:GHRR01025051.1.p2 GENE.GHRR01025051.1~~GHRR01025051.1.p2  ORF type:complete len:129 (-),score=45.64 GHRR01025051.1:313-699(-)
MWHTADCHLLPSACGVGCNVNALAMGLVAAALPGHSCSALVESISNGKFAGLKELNIIGCDLQLEQLTAIMKAVATNGCLPQLNTLELGANPGVQADGFEEQIGSLRSSRPGLDVHWRVADSDNAPDQ